MKRLGWLFLISFSLLLGACSLGVSDEDVCREDGALFADKFDGTETCGWALYNRGGTVVSIEEEALRISTSQPGQIWWTNPGRQFDDVIVTVDARQLEGPNDNAFGIICRYQNEENFYLFLISSDGYYMIGKYQSGTTQIQYLSGNDEFVFSDVITQGAAVNQIRAGCVGNQLTLSVNGIQLDSVTDPTFVTGDVGLGLSTFEPGTAVIQFDDFRVLAP
ncbi:MAG: hypothetical protein KC419_23220 [Anaerolineales bacterium]|nr:hypothetical protein [Anaerolineales bacterium]MCA9931424.1 hypothetical protein [Anaerolineales bacterium]